MVLHRRVLESFERSMKKEFLKRERFLMPGWPGHGAFGESI